METHSSIPTWENHHGQRSLTGYSPWGQKESDMTETLSTAQHINELWRRKWQPTPVFLPGKSHGQRSQAVCSPWGCKESDTTEYLSAAYINHDTFKEFHKSVNNRYAFVRKSKKITEKIYLSTDMMCICIISHVCMWRNCHCPTSMPPSFFLPVERMLICKVHLATT